MRQPNIRRQQFAYLHRHRFDIIFIQETHSCFSDNHYWANEWGGKIIYSHGTTVSKGVAIVFGSDFSFDISRTYCDDHGRCIIVDINHSGCTLTLVSVYGPNIDNATFFGNVSTRLSDFQCDNIIFGGDFNFVFNLDLDKKGVLEEPILMLVLTVLNSWLRMISLTFGGKGTPYLNILLGTQVLLIFIVD